MSCLKDLINKKINKLTVIKYINNSQCLCKCDCGNEKIVSAYELKRGHYKSCGCVTGNTKHGGCGTHLYEVWKSMKARCYNPHDKYYKNYGGRNIQVCDEWRSDFVPFQKWSSINGYKQGLSLDRIDNDKNYEPDNCRWVTQREQANNKSNNRKVLYCGKLCTLYELEKITGITRQNLYQRLFVYKWDIQRTIKQPVRKGMH